MTGTRKFESDDVRETFSKFFTILKVENENDILSFKIPENEYNKEKFEELYFQLKELGYYSYTNGKGEIITFRKEENPNRRNLKLLLMLLTILSMIYAGYAYSFGYYPGMNSYVILALDLTYFVFPLILILFLRELPKFIIRKKRKQKYSLPLFIPNPFLMGTMGIINAPDEPYLNSDDEILAGFFSLILGFVASASILILGYMGLSLYNGGSYVTNGSSSIINIPLLIQLFAGHVIPSSGFLDPLSLAGWSGLIFTSFNAFPIGLLDGGMVLSGFNRTLRKNVSYIFITIMIFIAFTFLAWLILPLFLAFLGMGTIEPVDSNYLRANKRAFLAIGIAMALAIIGLTPYPVHIGTPQMEVFYNGQWDVAVNGSRNIDTYNIMVRNYGQNNIIPGFSLSPTLSYDVSTNNSVIHPGTVNTFTIAINTTRANMGMNNPLLKIYVGSTEKTLNLAFFKINPTSSIEMETTNQTNSTRGSSFLVNITLFNTGAANATERFLIGVPNQWSYDITVGNSTNKPGSVPLEDNGSYIFGPYPILKADNSGLNAIYIEIKSIERPTSNIYFAAYNNTNYGQMLTIGG